MKQLKPVTPNKKERETMKRSTKIVAGGMLALFVVALSFVNTPVRFLLGVKEAGAAEIAGGGANCPGMTTLRK